jgi:hypothetical protein
VSARRDQLGPTGKGILKCWAVPCLWGATFYLRARFDPDFEKSLPSYSVEKLTDPQLVKKFPACYGT